MVPIHDTDVAEERWSKGEWKNYELWEKVESRLEKRNRSWVIVAIVVFVVLSSIPVIAERMPKWKTRTLTRKLAFQIGEVKKRASLVHKAYQISFASASSLEYSIFEKENCKTRDGKMIEQGQLASEQDQQTYMLIGSHMGEEIGVPGLVRDYCYDPYLGSSYQSSDTSIVGFGIIPVKDLTEKRTDRLSVLLLTGPSAEISLD